MPAPGVGSRTCPYCGWTISAHVYTRHVSVCRLRPDDDDLVSLWLDLGCVTRVANEIGVDCRIARRWLKGVGIDTDRPLVSGSTPPTRPPLAGREFAPRYSKARSGCEGCPEYEECRRRLAVDLWTLCCIPSQHEVAWAYRDGRIGFDGNMPEWLPQVLEAIA